MTQTAHTPGTQIAIKTDAEYCLECQEPHTNAQNGNREILSDLLWPVYDKQEMANARLIAIAPEMFKELQGIGHQTTITTEHFNRIQILIAKAKEEP